MSARSRENLHFIEIERNNCAHAWTSKMNPSMAFCKDAVRSVENIQVRDLMKLLGTVKAGHGRHRHRKLPDKPQKTDHKRQGEIQMAITTDCVREIFKGLENDAGAAFSAC
jgi:hypothetical protein